MGISSCFRQSAIAQPERAAWPSLPILRQRSSDQLGPIGVWLETYSLHLPLPTLSLRRLRQLCKSQHWRFSTFCSEDRYHGRHPFTGCCRSLNIRARAISPFMADWATRRWGCRVQRFGSYEADRGISVSHASIPAQPFGRRWKPWNRGVSVRSFGKVYGPFSASRRGSVSSHRCGGGSSGHRLLATDPSAYACATFIWKRRSSMDSATTPLSLCQRWIKVRAWLAEWPDFGGLLHSRRGWGAVAISSDDGLRLPDGEHCRGSKGHH